MTVLAPNRGLLTPIFPVSAELAPGERRPLAHAAALPGQEPDPETGDLLFARFDPRYALRDRTLVLTWRDAAGRRYRVRFISGPGGVRVLGVRRSRCPLRRLRLFSGRTPD